MTGNRDWLIDLNPNVKNKLRFADNNTISAKGIWKMMITHKDGKIAYMHDVVYVLTMKNSLLSLGQLFEKGFTMAKQQNHIEIYDSKQMLVLKAPLSKNRTFKINLDANAIQCLSTINTEEESWLWPNRHGHLNFKTTQL